MFQVGFPICVLSSLHSRAGRSFCEKSCWMVAPTGHIKNEAAIPGSSLKMSPSYPIVFHAMTVPTPAVIISVIVNDESGTPSKRNSSAGPKPAPSADHAIRTSEKTPCPANSATAKARPVCGRPADPEKSLLTKSTHHFSPLRTKNGCETVPFDAINCNARNTGIHWKNTVEPVNLRLWCSGNTPASQA